MHAPYVGVGVKKRAPDERTQADPDRVEGLDYVVDDGRRSSNERTPDFIAFGFEPPADHPP